MDDKYRNRIKKKNCGQIVIPAFGNWEYANDLPITQYFDSARQPSLPQYTDFADFQKPARTVNHTKRQSGACAEADHAPRQHRRRSNGVEMRARIMKDQNVAEVYKQKVKVVNIVPKPVDEDLYKIPPELLHISKKKRMLRFVTKCLNPCSVA